MKKNKVIIVEPVFNNNVHVSGGQFLTEPVEVENHDHVTITLSMEVSGWVFGSPETVEKLRENMHEKVDRQIDRMKFVS
jgi:hypothetical protein